MAESKITTSGPLFESAKEIIERHAKNIEAEIQKAAQEHFNQSIQSTPEKTTVTEPPSRNRNGAPNNGDFRSSLHIRTDRFFPLIEEGDGVDYGPTQDGNHNRNNTNDAIGLEDEKALQETKEWIESQISVIAEKHIADMVTELNGGGG